MPGRFKLKRNKGKPRLHWIDNYLFYLFQEIGFCLSHQVSLGHKSINYRVMKIKKPQTVKLQRIAVTTSVEKEAALIKTEK